MKRLDGSIKYHLCFPCQAREFANTIPLDVDGDTAALQYFRFEPLHSQGNPIPIHAQARWQKAGPATKVFGREGAGRENLLPQKGFPPRSFSFFTSSSACLPSPKQKNPRRSGDKKDPLALRAARGSRTIFGSGLLSHMTLCSIIGDGELNFRVRNGVGCTLSSMATKEIWQIY